MDTGYPHTGEPAQRLMASSQGAGWFGAVRARLVGGRAHSEVEAPVAALDGLLAVLRPAQVQVDELVAEGLLLHVPVCETSLGVDGPAGTGLHKARGPPARAEPNAALERTRRCAHGPVSPTRPLGRAAVLILLPVDRTHEVALLLEALGEVGGDEAAGAGDADLQLRVTLGELLLGDGGKDHACLDVLGCARVCGSAAPRNKVGDGRSFRGGKTRGRRPQVRK